MFSHHQFHFQNRDQAPTVACHVVSGPHRDGYCTAQYSSVVQTSTSAAESSLRSQDDTLLQSVSAIRRPLQPASYVIV